MAGFLAGLPALLKMLGTSVVGGAAATAASLPIMYAMTPGMEGSGGVGGVPPQSDEEAMQALMALLQGGGVDSRSMLDLKRELYASQAERRMMDILNMRGPASFAGSRPDLEAIIRGNEEMLGKLAYKEPPTPSEIFAKYGLLPRDTA
jgi:hypothetical protein